MQVFQAAQDLLREALGNLLVELAELPQHTADTATRDVFKEQIEVVRRLLEAEILDDIGMLQIAKGRTLALDSVHDDPLALVDLIGGRLGQLDLLHRDHLAGVGVQCEEYLRRE